MGGRQETWQDSWRRDHETSFLGWALGLFDSGCPDPWQVVDGRNHTGKFSPRVSLNPYLCYALTSYEVPPTPKLFACTWASVIEHLMMQMGRAFGSGTPVLGIHTTAQCFSIMRYVPPLTNNTAVVYARTAGNKYKNRE